MKKRIITIGSIAVTAILMALIGSAILPSAICETVSHKLIRISDDVVAIYESATADFLDSGAATMEIKTVQQLVTNGEILTEQAEKSLSYYGYDTEELIAASNELLKIGTHTIETSEAFVEGIAYVSIDQSNFKTAYSAQDYQKRLIPAALFESKLYKTVSAYDNGSEYLLYFNNPTNAENWAEMPDWNFSDAQGFALIDHNGNLLQSAYSATYQYLVLGAVKDTLHFTVYVNHTPTAVQIDLPESTSDYTSISYFDGPRMLEKACGYLMKANNVTAHYSDRIFCQAFGDERVKTTSLYAANNKDFSARIVTENILTNTGQLGDTTRHLHDELFIDGVYTIRVDGGAPTENETINAESMQNYCKDQLVSTIMLPKDIIEVRITETETTFEIQFIPNTDFAASLSSNACQTLYQNPNLLNEMAESSTVEKLESSLTLNKRTGLPLYSGVEYSSSYTIEGVPYQLQYKAGQSYNIASNDTQNKINEAAGQ